MGWLYFLCVCHVILTVRAQSGRSRKFEKIRINYIQKMSKWRRGKFKVFTHKHRTWILCWRNTTGRFLYTKHVLSLLDENTVNLMRSNPSINSLWSALTHVRPDSLFSLSTTESHKSLVPIALSNYRPWPLEIRNSILRFKLHVSLNYAVLQPIKLWASPKMHTSDWSTIWYVLFNHQSFAGVWRLLHKTLHLSRVIYIAKGKPFIKQNYSKRMSSFHLSIFKYVYNLYSKGNN